MPLDVTVNWKLVEDDPGLWDATRVLYAWHLPDDDHLVYLGKADFRSVRQRFNCRSKDPVWDHIEDTFGVDEVDLRVGEIATDARLTAQLLEDVESLLIRRLQPCANVRCIQSRIERPGLRVRCTGDWPSRRASFTDR